MVLPSVIEKAVKNLEGTIVPHDTVIYELRVWRHGKTMATNILIVHYLWMIQMYE